MLDQKSRDEFIANLRLQATPLDFEQLIKDGVLARHSGRWYQALVPIKDLPEIIAKQADATESQGDRTLLRLPSGWSKAQKQYRQLTGKSYAED